MTVRLPSLSVFGPFLCAGATLLASACSGVQAEPDRAASIPLPSMEKPEVPCSDAPAPSSRPGTAAADAPGREEPTAAAAGTDDDEATPEAAPTQELGGDDDDEESTGGLRSQVRVP